SAVVKPDTPSGREAMQPIPQQLSASVITAPACRKSFGARNSLRMSIRASAEPRSIAINSRPNRPGSRPSIAVWKDARREASSADVLDRLDREVETVHLTGVAERVEKVLQPLQVVVEAEPPHMDHRDLVVRDGAALRLAGTAGRHEQVRDLGLRAAVTEVRAVKPDPAVAERGGQDQRVRPRLGQKRLAPDRLAVNTQPAGDRSLHENTVSEHRAPRKRVPECLHAQVDGCRSYLDPAERRGRAVGRLRRGRETAPLPDRLSEPPARAPALGLQRPAADLA